MLTPCFYKRGLIWLLFFVISLVVVPLFTEDEVQPATPAKTAQTKQLVPRMQGR